MHLNSVEMLQGIVYLTSTIYIVHCICYPGLCNSVAINGCMYYREQFIGQCPLMPIFYLQISHKCIKWHIDDIGMSLFWLMISDYACSLRSLVMFTYCSGSMLMCQLLWNISIDFNGWYLSGIGCKWYRTGRLIVIIVHF